MRIRILGVLSEERKLKLLGLVRETKGGFMKCSFFILMEFYISLEDADFGH